MSDFETLEIDTWNQWRKETQEKLDYDARNTLRDFIPEGTATLSDHPDSKAWMNQETSPLTELGDSPSVNVPPLVLSESNGVTQVSEPIKSAMRTVSMYTINHTDGGTIMQGGDPIRVEVEMPIDIGVHVVMDEIGRIRRGPVKQKGEGKQPRNAKRKTRTESTEQDAGKEENAKKRSKSSAPPLVAKSPTSSCDECAKAGSSCLAQIRNNKPLKSCMRCHFKRKKCSWVRPAEGNGERIVEACSPSVRAKRKAAIDAETKLSQTSKKVPR